MINTIYIQKLRDLGFYSLCMDQMEKAGHKALFVNEKGRPSAVTLAECKVEIKNINHDLMMLKASMPREWTEHYKIVS
jgi:hypothetical protein